MENTNIAWKSIVQLLFGQNDYVSLSFVAGRMNCCKKTIKTLLKQHANLEFEYGFHLKTNAFREIKLIILDMEKFQDFLYTDREIAKDDSEDRMNQIITKLISYGDYVKIEQLADEMFISRASIDRLMSKIKEDVEKYQCLIETKSKYGIRIVGTEANKRICLAHHARVLDFGIDRELILQIQKTIMKIISEERINVSDSNFHNLVYHCSIAVLRIKQGHSCQDSKIDIQEQSYQKEVIASRKIVEALENIYQLQIPVIEQQYILMHLLGKRSLDQGNFITFETMSCVEVMISQITKKYGIDFSSNHEFKSALALHLQPMLTRVQCGLKQSNPLLEHIKANMHVSYELAVCSAKALKERFNIEINEEEIGYIALHFELALEKAKCDEKKILIVCTSGKGTAKLIQYKLMKQFHYKNEEVELASIRQLVSLDLNAYSCIYTTVPISMEMPVPLIQLNLSELLTNEATVFNERTINKSSQMKFISSDLIFLNLELQSKEEIIKFLCKKIEAKYKHLKGFAKAVFERENLSTTEIGNRIALPHPISYSGNDIIFAVATLEKAVLWKNRKVKVIFLVAYPESEIEMPDIINQEIAELSCDYDAVQDLLKFTDSKEMIEYLYKRLSR